MIVVEEERHKRHGDAISWEKYKKFASVRWLHMLVVYYETSELVPMENVEAAALSWCVRVTS